MVAIDHCTKWQIALAVLDCSAESVAELKAIFLPFGCPVEIVADRGSASETLLKLYLEWMQVRHNLTSAYHPTPIGSPRDLMELSVK